MSRLPACAVPAQLNAGEALWYGAAVGFGREELMETTTSPDGTRIAFERSGEGPPVVLIGGAFCDHRARAAGKPLALELSRQFTVYCYDRRGRGQSGDTLPHAVAREVEDLSALLAVAGGLPHVYGHSSGAILALEGALTGLPIGKLALYEPPLVLQKRAALAEDLPERLRSLIASGERARVTELFLTEAIGLPAAAVAHMKAGASWPELEGLAHTLSYDAELAQRPAELVARATKVRQAALLVDGEKSAAWMRAGVAMLAGALSRARYVEMSGQTHDVDPKLLGPLLVEFFSAEPVVPS